MAVGADWQARVRIGGVDITHRLTGGGFSSSIDDAAKAWFEIDAVEANTAIADLFAEVEWVYPSTGFQAFVGHVVAAAPSVDGRIRIDCQSLPDLMTSLAPRFEAFGLLPQEVPELIARSAGLRSEQISIHGLDQLPDATMASFVPIAGLEVDTALIVEAGLQIITVDDAAKRLSGFEPGPWAAEFDRTTAFAVVTGTATSLWKHEAAAIARADLMFAWMQCRAMFGLPVLPDGRLNHFVRASSRAGMSRLGFVMTEASPGRRWIHDVDVVGSTAKHNLRSDDPSWLLDSHALSETLRQAMLALRRATADPNPTQKVVALWEAVEFFVAPLKLPRRFTKSEVRELRATVQTDNEELLDRALALLEGINSPPLLAKFRASCAERGIPLRDDEMLLLGRLRKMRNRVAHGTSGAELCTSDEIDAGLSVVARALLFQAFESRNGQDDET